MKNRNHERCFFRAGIWAWSVYFSVFAPILYIGCQPSTKKEETVSTVTTTAPIEDSVVELTSVKAKVDEDNIVRIELAYKFTKGGPRKVYQCEFFFPGSSVHGIKDMAGWELKQEGVIKSGLVGQGEPGDTIEAIMREADSPSLGYHEVSNRVVGKVER